MARKYTVRDGRVFISMEELASILRELAAKNMQLPITANGLERVLAISASDALEQTAVMFETIGREALLEITRKSIDPER
jgi:DNA-directed RNA polymerase subunit H (RpoH/RPB5)